jgi:hypothetical protein
MKRALAPAVALAAISTGALLLAADIESGLQVGDPTQAFTVKDITGPAAGTSLCYR